jgi:hypothetical protein
VAGDQPTIQDLVKHAKELREQLTAGFSFADPAGRAGKFGSRM